MGSFDLWFVLLVVFGYLIHKEAWTALAIVVSGVLLMGVFS